MPHQLRNFLIIIALVIALYLSYTMTRIPLWGWRPLPLLVLFWMAFALLFTRKSSRAVWRLFLLSCLSGILLATGFPPSPFTPFMFTGFIPLLLIEDEILKVRKGAGRGAFFLYSLNAFLIWNIGTTWWLLNTAVLPGLVAIGLNALIMATVLTMYHQLHAMLKSPWRPVVLIAVWITFEYVHLFWDISWPWLTLGNSMAQYPSWIQWYAFTGVFGGSLWIMGGNYLIFKVLKTVQAQKKVSLRRWVGPLSWVLLPALVSIIWYYSIPAQMDEGIEVAVVQPNFEPHYEKFDIDKRTQLERFIKLSDSILTTETQYLVFPETSFGLVHLNEIERDWRIRALKDLLEAYPDVFLVTGLASYRTHPEEGPLPETVRVLPGRSDTMYFDVQNSAIQMASDAPIQMYFKSKLVPGAEMFPFRKFLPFIKPLVDKLDGSIEGHTKQKERGVFHSPYGNVAPVICYESVYGEYVGGYVHQGADMIFIITNDGWWDNTPGHVQHLKFASLRAIEHRRPIARSANTGISCFVNTRGDILQPTRYDEPVAIRGKVKPNTTMTFYTKWGDVIARIACLVAITCIILSIVRRFPK